MAYFAVNIYLETCLRLECIVHVWHKFPHDGSLLNIILRDNDCATSILAETGPVIFDFVYMCKHRAPTLI